MALHRNAPKWQRELDGFLGIKSTFIIEGNIHDLYPLYQDDGGTCYSPLRTVLSHIIDSGSAAGQYMQFFHDPVHGFDPRSDQAADVLRRYERITCETDDAVRQTDPVPPQLHCLQGGQQRYEQLREENPTRDIFLSKVVRTMLIEPAPIEGEEQTWSTAVILDRAGDQPDQAGQGQSDVFYKNLRIASTNAHLRAVPAPGQRALDLYNTLILIVDKRGDVPAWFYMGNPNVQIITIPRPDRQARQSYIRSLSGLRAQPALPAPGNGAQDPAVSAPLSVPGKQVFPGGERDLDRLADLTDHLSLQEIDQLREMYARAPEDYADVTELVSKFKYGQKESVWTQLRASLKKRDIQQELRRRVKGQDQVLDRVATTIKRAVVGLSGVEHSSDGKPRGILFLAGPTGTGKTELVKAVAEMLFGDERAVVRFDMSEFADASSGHRLFGAPPGYVGYGNGGELTNAVRSNPFSVLLFDEIEKAHESIMDKFLQILEDGRMTDGEGQTVFFSETLIFFTSNLGFYRTERAPDGSAVRVELAGPNSSYEQTVSSVDSEMKRCFKSELRNRLGDNVLVFQYIDEAGTAAIVDSKLDSIRDSVRKRAGVDVAVDDGARQWLAGQCLARAVRQFGGRGIVNVLASQLISPLGEFIFDQGLTGGRVTVSRPDGGDGGLRFRAE